MSKVVWTEYFQHRARLRRFDLDRVEQIVRFSEERYLDTASQRMVATGSHGDRLVMIPYDPSNDVVTPGHHPRNHAAANQLPNPYRKVPPMSKPKLLYFEKDDVLHLIVSEDDEASSVEIGPNITAELNVKGELIGVEIIDASTFVRDTILEGVNAKLLHLTRAAP